jgi:hypothetical protein
MWLLSEAMDQRGVMLAGHLGLVIAAIFSGAALYINVVERLLAFALATTLS